VPPEDVSFPRGVNDLEKYADSLNKYKDRIPINARAAILYNHMLERKQLTSTYNKIYSGDKIKWTYLQMPNPLHEDVVGFLNVLPKKFGLHDYIDYDQQFEKAFLSPIDHILKAAGWSAEKQNTFEGLFE